MRSVVIPREKDFRGVTYRLEAVDEEGSSDGLLSLVPLFVLRTSENVTLAKHQEVLLQRNLRDRDPRRRRRTPWC